MTEIYEALVYKLKQKNIPLDAFQEFLSLPEQYPLLTQQLQRNQLDLKHYSDYLDQQFPVVPNAYILGEELGRGGMGVVYKAYHPETRQIVALKILLSGDQPSEQILQRFYREFQTLSKLQHPGIIRFLDSGTKDQSPYFVMEYVDGTALTQKLRENLSLPRKLRLIQKVLEALEFAHQQGVLHRDLKLDNILVTKAGEPKIADFGLSKQIDFSPELQKLTKTGMLLGTPHYMSPEQAQGKELSVQSDIYSMGVCLYRLLTKKFPHTAESLPELLKQILSQAPTRPSVLVDGLHRDLETIVLKALEKDPAQRYASAKIFADDLARLISGLPIHTTPLTRKERWQRWMRQHFKTIRFFFLQFALILSASIWFLFTQNIGRTRVFERVYTHALDFLSQLRDVKKQADLDSASFLKLHLNALNAFNYALQIDRTHLPSIHHKKSIALELFEFALQKHSYPLGEYVLQELDQLPISSELEKTTWRERFQNVWKKQDRLTLKRFERWIQLLKHQSVSKAQRSDALFEVSKMPGEVVFQRLVLEMNEGHHYFLTKIPSTPLQEFYGWIIEVLGRSENPRAKVLLLTALTEMAKQQVVIPESSRTLARNKYMILLMSALANLKATEYVDPIDKIRTAMKPDSMVYLQSEKAFYKLVRFRNPELTEEISSWNESRFMQQISFLEDKGSISEAVQLCNKAISFYPKSLQFYNSRGLLRRKLSDFSESLKDFNKALEIPSHLKKEQAYIYYNRGLTKQDLKDFSGAILDLKKSLQLYPQFSEAYNDLGGIFLRLNQKTEALAHYNKAIQMNPKFAFAYGNRGNLKLEQGDLTGAIVDYDQAILLNPQHPNFYDCRGSAKQSLGKLTEAIADFDEAILLSPQNAGHYYNRGNAKMLKKDFEGAIIDYTEAIRLRPQWASAYENRGNARSYTNDLTGAIEDYSQSVQLNSDDPRSYYNRGQIYWRLKNEVSAKQDFQLFLKVSKNTKDPSVQSTRLQLIQMFPEWKDQ